MQFGERRDTTSSTDRATRLVCEKHTICRTKKKKMLPTRIAIGAARGKVFSKVDWLRVSNAVFSVTVHPDEIAMSAATRVLRSRLQQQSAHATSDRTTVDVHASHPQPRKSVPRSSITAKPVTSESSWGKVLKMTKDVQAPFTMARPRGKKTMSANASPAPATPPPPDATYCTQQATLVGKDTGRPKRAPEATA